tara:strand:- start:1110 stop:1607 length:498 start_codon:yes stop_codon:yes gene_type:complete
MIELILSSLFILIGLFSLVMIARFYLLVRAFLYELSAFVQEPDGDQPSGLAVLVNEIGKSAGRSIAMEVKTTAMGKASGEARLGKAIQGDIAQDQLNAENPLVGSMLDMFPSLKKRAMKNPGVIQYLVQHLMQAGAGKGAGGPANLSHLPGNGKGDYGSRLNRYK